MKQLLIRFLKQQKIFLVGIFMLGVVANIFSILIPISYQYLFDSIITKGEYNGLWKYSLFVIIILFGYILFDMLSNHMLVKIMINLNQYLSEKFYQKIMYLEEEIEYYSKGEIITRMMNDINTIVSILGGYVLTSLLSILTYISIVVLIFNISIVLGGICLISSPLFFITSQYFGKKIESKSVVMKKQAEDYFDVFDESIEARAVVKLYDCYDYQYKRYKMKLTEYLKSNQKVLNYSVCSRITFTVLGLMFPIITLLVGTRLIATGDITLGVLMSILSLLNYIIMPSKILSNGFIAMKQFKVACDRIDVFYNNSTVMNEKVIQEKEGIKQNNAIIKLENVSFKFKEKEIFKQISFQIYKKELISIVGINGSGKTTLIKMLSGLLMPSEGQIYINGNLVQKINLPAVRKMIGLVLQKDMLFADTVNNNICLGKESNTKHNNIIQENLLEKEITKNMTNLSGGEIQKVVLARALYKNAPILIIDEGTSQIDRFAKQYIYHLIEETKDKKTILLVDHQLEYVGISDRILFIQDKSHIYLEKHQRLLEMCSEYSNLFK